MTNFDVNDKNTHTHQIIVDRNAENECTCE